MYLQTGDERLWLAQKHQTLEAEAAGRRSAVSKRRAARAIAGAAVHRAAGMTAGLVERLVRPSLAGASRRSN